MYILHLCVHLHLTGSKEVWSKIVRLWLQFTKYGVRNDVIKRPGTTVKFLRGLECSIGTLGVNSSGHICNIKSFEVKS